MLKVPSDFGLRVSSVVVTFAIIFVVLWSSCANYVQTKREKVVFFSLPSGKFETSEK
jgi:hypothetical protein